VEATENSAWHLLLEDLTDSHFVATQWPIPPAIEQCGQIVRGLARIHAGWWDDPRIGVTFGKWRDAAGWEALLREFALTLERFVDRFGQILPPERLDLYARLLDRAPRLLARYHSRRNLTIIHGDAHFWNFFLPRSETGDNVRLLDWEGWSIDTPTTDLAYMLAMLWYPERRKRLEQHLVAQYHAALIAENVNGYDRRSLDDDYRLSVLWLITRPVWQAMAGIGGGVWWNNLERIFLAVDDLGCRELLD
jgi:thiamine kinase-like enzyme